MKIQVNNITFNYIEESTGIVPEEEELGLSYLFLPGPMARRFAKEFDHKDEFNRLLIPHYDRYEMYDDEENPYGKKSHVFDSGHDCYNADTQIVLMNYLFSKRRKYELDYRGLDPYWLFHDSFHAQNDVYGGQVSGIYSHVEHDRLLQGAEFSSSKGYHIQADTVKKLLVAWESRWSYSERGNFCQLDVKEFKPFMNKWDYKEVKRSLEY